MSHDPPQKETGQNNDPDVEDVQAVTVKFDLLQISFLFPPGAPTRAVIRISGGEPTVGQMQKAMLILAEKYPEAFPG